MEIVNTAFAIGSTTGGLLTIFFLACNDSILILPKSHRFWLWAAAVGCVWVGLCYFEGQVNERYYIALSTPPICILGILVTTILNKIGSVHREK
jgi:hypothetical protein